MNRERCEQSTKGTALFVRSTDGIVFLPIACIPKCVLNLYNTLNREAGNLAHVVLFKGENAKMKRKEKWLNLVSVQINSGKYTERNHGYCYIHKNEEKKSTKRQLINIPTELISHWNGNKKRMVECQVYSFDNIAVDVTNIK